MPEALAAREKLAAEVCQAQEILQHGCLVQNGTNGIYFFRFCCDAN